MSWQDPRELKNAHQRLKVSGKNRTFRGSRALEMCLSGVVLGLPSVPYFTSIFFYQSIIALNVVLIFAVQGRESAICIHMSLPSQTSLPPSCI